MDNGTNPNSAGWTFFVKLSFGVAIAAMVVFIFFMSGDLLTKGYLALNSLFMVSATIMLSKTLRDEHEAKRAVSRMSNARPHQVLSE